MLLLYFGRIEVRLYNMRISFFFFFDRHEQGATGEVVPRFTDRLVIDRTLRGRLGPGGRFFDF